MMSTPDLKFEPAEEADILPLTAIMVRVFDADAQRERGAPTAHPPGYESGEWLREWLTKSTLYKIIKNKTIIGGFLIILNLPTPNWNYLGSIFVDLPYQNQAIGSRTLQFIEQTFPAHGWQTMTNGWATRNHHFYEKNGYIKVKEFFDETTGDIAYIYEKASK